MSAHTRRDFIAQTGTLATALAAAPLLSLSASDAIAQGAKKKLGWALCGLGGLSENQTAPALQKADFSRLAGVITDTPAKAGKWKEKYGLKDASIFTYDSMHKLADNPDIDVIYIVTPNALHAEQAAAAFKAGKHVFCEKPMEVSVAKCQQMINDGKAANRRLGVAYRCQYDPNHLECIRIARSKEFGGIKIVESTFNVSIGDPGQWRLKRALSGGGSLMDVGIYALQSARYLTGEEPVEVRALEGKTNPTKYAEVDESMIWQMRFPSGAIANCSSSYETGVGTRFRVYAEKGWFGLEPAFFYSGNRGERSDRKQINLPADDLFKLEMDDFSRCILENRSSKVSGEEGLRDVQIMMAIYEAARTGRAVTLKVATS
jgi:predicted dehydrogenase